MIIRIIKNRKISQYLCRQNILGVPIDYKQYYQPSQVVQFSRAKKPVGFMTSLHYYFSKDANGKGKQSQNKDQTQIKQEEHKPKIIEITKQEYLGMKKFLEDITLSMPDPLRYASSPVRQNEEAQLVEKALKKESKIETEDGADYFSTVEQKLSFQLLKLSQSVQFLPIFREYQQRDDANLKLIILHRYCSIGGSVGNQEGEISRLAYSYMADILSKMRKLQQNQLELFLSLYIGLHQQIQNKKEFSTRKFTNQLPKLLCSLDSLPLVQNPSHSASRLIVLLLQFYEIQTENNEKNKIIVQILKHYEPALAKEEKVHETDETSQKQEKQLSQLKNLAYIGITAYMHNLSNHCAIPKLTFLINEKLKEQITQNLNKQLIRTSQHILQNVYKLNHCSPAILNNMRLLQQTLMKFIVESIKLTHQEINMGASIQSDDILDWNEQATSGSIQAMLYTTLLVLEQSKNKISRQWSLEIIKSILQNYKERKTQKINMAQLGQLWKSCSIMYKLIKKEKQIKKQGDIVISTEKLLELVENFINKTSIQEQVKIIINPNNNSVIQEYAYNLQAILFQCLVAYRLVLPPMSNYSLKDLKNIQNQISSENNPNYRRVLMDLLTSYRKVCQSLYSCSLINDSNQPQIHNLLIVCMISEAYPMLNSTDSSEKISKYLLSPTILELLKHFGVSHSKYGNYGKIIVQKYD